MRYLDIHTGLQRNYGEAEKESVIAIHIKQMIDINPSSMQIFIVVAKDRPFYAK